MTKLEKIYDNVYKDDIQIINAHFSETKKAACLYSDLFKAIVIDKPKIENRIEETEIMAEEFGHFATGALYMIDATYNTPLGRSNRAKYESKARQWAIRELLPPQYIREAIETVGEKFCDIAEYCQVSVEYVYTAIEYYATKGIYFK